MWKTKNPTRRLPNSCCTAPPRKESDPCPTDTFYVDGCVDEIEKFVKDNSIVVIVLLATFAAFEIMVVVSAVCLCKAAGKPEYI